MSFLAEHRFPSLVAAERQHIQAWVIALRERRKPATVQLYLLAAVLFYQWLIEEGERTDNPTERISALAPPQVERTPFSQEEIDAILASQNAKTFLGARNIALFLVLLDTGLRREELCRMRLEDLDWKHGTIKVMGKGAKERRVRIGAAAQRAVAAYVRLAPAIRQRLYRGCGWRRAAASSRRGRSRRCIASSVSGSASTSTRTAGATRSRRRCWTMAWTGSRCGC